ncbi:MAG: hypothetical protein JWM68_1192 [Verrucomicrobiales bacterium]|nr:hypothetical protein [Verrucomicrobiales bacterium]
MAFAGNYDELCFATQGLIAFNQFAGVVFERNQFVCVAVDVKNRNFGFHQWAMRSKGLCSDKCAASSAGDMP